MRGATTGVVLHFAIFEVRGIAARNLSFPLHRRKAASTYEDWECDFSWGSESKAVNRGVRRPQGEHGLTLGWCESLL